MDQPDQHSPRVIIESTVDHAARRPLLCVLRSEVPEMLYLSHLRPSTRLRGQRPPHFFSRALGYYLTAEYMTHTCTQRYIIEILHHLFPFGSLLHSSVIATFEFFPGGKISKQIQTIQSSNNSSHSSRESLTSISKTLLKAGKIEIGL